MKAANFAQVTVIDFAMMEGQALKNKARVIGHEGNKLFRGEQSILTTIGGVLETVADPMEVYYDFPSSSQFYIERGH